MLNIFLCEDNTKQRNTFSELINKTILIENFDLSFPCETANPHILLEKAKHQTGTGLYFLDIDLQSDMNGLTLAQELRKIDPRGFIVFVTTHSEMSYMTFTYKVEAMDFIIKDNPKELQARIHQCIIDAYSRYISRNNQIQKTFTITTSDKDFCVALKDILFFETSDNVHRVILHTVKRTIEFTGKLKNIEPLLDERFYRCHRSYLINRDHIKEIDLKERIVIMSNDEICLASGKMLKQLLK